MELEKASSYLKRFLGWEQFTLIFIEFVFGSVLKCKTFPWRWFVWKHFKGRFSVGEMMGYLKCPMSKHSFGRWLLKQRLSFFFPFWPCKAVWQGNILSSQSVRRLEIIRFCAVWSKRPTILLARASLHIEVGLVAPQIRFSAADMTPLMGKRQAQEKHKDLRNVKNDKETYSHIWLLPNPNLLKQTIFTIRKTWDAILRKEGVVLWRSKKPSFWTAPVWSDHKISESREEEAQNRRNIKINYIIIIIFIDIN